MARSTDYYALNESLNTRLRHCIMDNLPRITTVPSKAFTGYARKSTTGANYPGTPATDYVPAYTSRYEWLRDGKGLKAYNPCEHYTKWCSLDRPFIDGSDTWVSPGNPSQGYWNVDYVTSPFVWGGARYGSSSYGFDTVLGTWEQPIVGIPRLFVETEAGRRYINLPDATLIKSCVDRSLSAMLPGIRPSLSLLNTLYELKDIKTLARTTERQQHAFDAVRALIGAMAGSKQAVKLLSGKTKSQLAYASLRSLLKAGSDGWLQAQFNVAPLLRDIAGIKSAVSEAHRQVQNLVQRAGRTQVSHYRTSLRNVYVDRIDNAQNTIPTAFVGDVVKASRDVKYSVAEFCATMEYRYKMPYFLSPEDYLPRALNDVLGLNWNPAIIWNAIPWTFVVDWFIGVSRWLDQFKTRSIEPVTSISRYCYSIHVARDIKLSVGEDANVLPFARIGEEVYYRKPHVPDVYRSIELSGLNPKEFSLAGALALTRRGVL